MNNLQIKLTSKFRSILSLPNYIIAGFTYRFNQSLPDQDNYIDPDEDIDLSNYDVDSVTPNKLHINASSYFNCTTTVINKELTWSITTEKDTDERYRVISLYYFDLMQDDLLKYIGYNGSKEIDNVNLNMELAGIISPYRLIKQKSNVDIPNQIKLNLGDNKKVECSILTRRFNPPEHTHLLRTDITKGDYTNSNVNNKSLLRYKPTESLLNDFSISMNRATDSFMIGSSGLIQLDDVNKVNI